MEYQGKLIKGVGGLYEIRLADGSTVTCKAKGGFRHESIKPCIGDNVTVRDEGGYVLSGIAERKNCLIRPPISNVGVIFITFAAVEPEPALLNIDKLTCIAVHSGIRPVITVTKADLAPEKAEALAAIYRASGFTAFVSGADKSAVFSIRQYLHDECSGVISCFAGASGVGKSTLMTALFPELALKTGEISTRIARGKHTTRHVELYPLNRLFGDGTEGYIADTPGFSLLDFVRFDFFDKEALPDTFPEFEPYLGQCRYKRCTHLCEDGCAICEAVARGEIPSSRHESFVSLYHDLKDKHKWDK
ncbi:MAG: ribosome small subunit-dependent GTPase A [Ruminococcaceae bacterium]|nr:ribosome small subunit-dependent GTPase A [Oscillospiraceae bacterium]